MFDNNKDYLSFDYAIYLYNITMTIFIRI